MIKGNRESWPGDYLRYNYNLNNNSIVIDLGAHNGVFTENIFQKFNCFVYSFEPIFKHYESCLNKFKMIDKIKIYPSGLSSENKVVDFHIAGEASSIYFGDVLGEFGINLKKIDEFLLEEKIEIVDLIKMNIEGSEYELLEYMLNNNLITKFKNLQIQFHDNVFDGWEQKYHYIKENLKKLIT